MQQKTIYWWRWWCLCWRTIFFTGKKYQRKGEKQTTTFDKILSYHQKYDILLFLNKIKVELRNELLLLSIAIYSILYIKTEPKSKRVNLAFFREELSCYGNI